MPLLHGYRMENHRRPQPVEELPLPETLYIPLPGAEESYARIVPEGKEVAKGQVLSAPKYAAVAHAPAPGVMESVEFRHIPSCGNVWAAKLRVGGSRAIQPRPAQGQNRDERILRAAADAGIVDEMTGRPLYQELYRLRRREVSLLLVCGIEDDPWCSSALSVLAEAPEDVAEGLRLAAAFCGAEETGVAVCPENVRETRERFPSMRIEIAKERYPARAFLLRRLRAAGTAASLLGPQALAALAAAMRGEPQTQGVVTVSGDGVRTPRTLRFPTGTPLRELLAPCGLLEDASLVYVGPACQGQAVTDLDLPIPLHARCITALVHTQRQHRMACIGCGRCARVCPQGILPWQIHESLHGDKVDPFLLLNVQSCIGCAACTAVCPSGLPLSAEVARAAAIRKSGDFF